MVISRPTLPYLYKRDQEKEKQLCAGEIFVTEQ